MNGRALNFLGLGLVGIVGIAFLILTPRLTGLDTVLELTVYMIMAILALAMQESGRLADDTLVATVMSNLGLVQAMEAAGITVRRTAVGDRYVLEDLRAGGYFDHTSPTYGSPYEMERRAGISARVMGAENLAMSRDVDRAHLQLMASEGHRANLLNPAHDAIGVAVVPVPYGVLVVQLFLGGRHR